MKKPGCISAFALKQKYILAFLLCSVLTFGQRVVPQGTLSCASAIHLVWGHRPLRILQ